MRRARRARPRAGSARRAMAAPAAAAPPATKSELARDRRLRPVARSFARSARSDILRATPLEVGNATMFFFDPLYIVLLVVTLAITGWASWRVRSTYGKWSKVDSGINLDAFDFARRLLDRQGLQSVRIEPTPGQLTDHYDPRGKVLRVSTQVADASALTTAGLTSSGPRLSVAAAA